MLFRLTDREDGSCYRAFRASDSLVIYDTIQICLFIFHVTCCRTIYSRNRLVDEYWL